MKKIYLVLSQTNSSVSRVLHWATGAQYNHVSIALDDSMEELYSFGRRTPYNPFNGGFVRESKSEGTFKRFFDHTRLLILETQVSDETYERIRIYLSTLYQKRRQYNYNYLGVMMASCHVVFQQARCYYCSEFVRNLLWKFGLLDKKRMQGIVKPEDFLSLDEWRFRYEGTLRHYAKKSKKTKIREN